MDAWESYYICHFYPRSPCGERRRGAASCYLDNIISIHALLAESDNNINSSVNTADKISIHALLAESDPYIYILVNTFFNFYPRSPCGERRIKMELDSTASNFYPRSPCGERRNDYGQYYIRARISIHALLAESDSGMGVASNFKHPFLSTLSLRRATTWTRGSRVTYVISIHALLAESDGGINNHIKTYRNFYPRSPCGERPTVLTLICEVIAISIHALLAESDSSTQCKL